MQAPFWHGRPQRGAIPFQASSYADILAVRGFNRVESLSAMVAAWQFVIDLIGPDVVVCDFSPTLCLTVYDSLPNVMIGTSFALPPIEQPTFPRLPSDAEPQTSQQTLLEVVQQVQIDRRREAPPNLTSILAGERFVTVFPEIDAYRGVRREQCHGPIQPLPELLPLPAAPCVFAYLGDGRPIVEEVLVKLVESGLPTETYIRDVPESAKQRLRNRGVTVHERPQPMTEVLQRVGLVLHHGGASTAQLAMAAGRPQVCWPVHLEQVLTALQIQKMGLGVAVPSNPSVGTIADLIIQTAANSRICDQSFHWAVALRDRGFASPLEEIADRCLALIH